MQTWSFAISFATSQPGNRSEYIHVEGVLRSQQWWKTNSARYSLLVPLALKYLCMAGSLTPGRTFSVAGLALNRLHSALSPEHVDMLVVRPMHSNTDLLE